MDNEPERAATPESERKIKFSTAACKVDGKKALGRIRMNDHPAKSKDPAERSRQIVEEGLAARGSMVVAYSASVATDDSSTDGTAPDDELRDGWDEEEEEACFSWRKRDDPDSLWELSDLVQRNADCLARQK